MVVPLRKADCLRVFEPPLDAGNDNAGFDRDQFNTHQRDPDKRIDDDTFVKYAIQNLCKTRTSGRSPNHRCSSLDTHLMARAV